MKKINSFLLFCLIGIVSCTMPSPKKELAHKLNNVIIQVQDQTKKYICNPKFLETVAWKNFIIDLKKASNKVKSEEEFVKIFNQQTTNLPFTHFVLSSTQGSSQKSTAKAPFELKALNKTSSLLTIRNFAPDRSSMLSILDQLSNTKPSNLIIDLRNNPGGTLDAAVPLIQFLSNQLVHGGIFIGQAWFNQHNEYPTIAEIQEFTPLQDPSYDGFIKKLEGDQGMSLLIPPSATKAYKGKVFILINKNTASACEPLAFGLQHYKIGTLVGEKTAGAMLSARYFPVGDQYKLFIPEADYMTVTGERLDKVGVKPDISVTSEKALDYVLENLIQ